ncbi:hypothetical protein PoB_002789600, partial [Plakobranchus ocellatus]
MRYGQQPNYDIEYDNNSDYDKNLLTHLMDGSVFMISHIEAPPAGPLCSATAPAATNKNTPSRIVLNFYWLISSLTAVMANQNFHLLVRRTRAITLPVALTGQSCRVQVPDSNRTVAGENQRILCLVISRNCQFD